MITLLKILETIAAGWEQHSIDESKEGNPEAAVFWKCADDLRQVIVKYLESEMRVRYLYASQWRIGTLLTRPSDSNLHWQIQRDGFGGWVDQVTPAADTIRIYLEEMKS